MNVVLQFEGLSVGEIFDFLTKCDKQFFPALSSRVNLREYSEKLFCNSKIIYAKESIDIIGLVAFYINEKIHGYAFISLICVMDGYLGIGIGTKLMSECINVVKNENFKSIKLEVGAKNLKAISFYRAIGFKVEGWNQHVYKMTKLLN